MKKNTVKLAHIPKVTPKKTGVDDLLKKKGTKALKKTFDEATTVSETIKLRVRRGDKVDKKAREYLWEPYIPKGTLSGTVGLPGVGKSFFVLAVAASMSNGKLPYSEESCKPVNTLYMSYEGDPETSTIPRFEAMGGDLSRLFVVDGAEDEDGKPHTLTLKDVEAIEETINECQAQFVVIDPLQSFLGAKVDMNRANETRPVLEAVALLARRTGASVHIIRHVRKDNGNGRATNSGLGSQDITANYRSECLIGTSNSNHEHHAMLHIKHNDSERGPALDYKLEKVILHDVDGRPIKTAKLVWVGESILNAKDLLAAEQPRTQTKTDRAREWLREKLGKGRPYLATKLFEEWAEESGQEPKTAKRTLQSAAVGVIDRNRLGRRGKVMWQLMPPRKFEASNQKGLKGGQQM